MAGTGRFVVGGNWKCNGNTNSIAALVKDLNAGEIDADVEVICAPPMVYLPKVGAFRVDKSYVTLRKHALYELHPAHPIACETVLPIE
jgi:triosephosphate isomerase